MTRIYIPVLLLLIICANVYALEISVTDITIPVGGSGIVSIKVDDGTGILSGKITMQYDSDICIATDVSKTSLTDNFSLSHNVTSGQLIITFAGAEAISGGGSLFDVTFMANPKLKEGATSELTLSYVRLNEGAISATMKDGTLTVEPLPLVNVSMPNTCGSPQFEVLVPIKVDSAENIVSGRVVLQFDPQDLEFINALKTPMTSKCSVEHNVGGGKITITFASNNPLSGSGAILNVKFKILMENEGDKTTLDFSSLQFNEGKIPVAWTSAEVSICIITMDQLPDYITGNKLTVSGTAELGVSVEIFANGESKGATEINPDTKRFSIEISLTEDVRYEIVAKAKDGSGDVISESYPQTVIRDTTPPSAPTNVTDNVEGPSNDNTPKFCWTAPDDISGISGYYYSVDREPSEADDWMTGACVTLPPQGDGKHTFYVAAKDGAGHIGAVGSHVFEIDTISPDVPTLVAYTPDPTNNTKPTLAWNDVTDAARYHIQLDNDTNFISPIVDDDTLTSRAYTPASALPEGIIYWRVSSIDVAGNESDFPVSDNFTIDITPPGVPTLVSYTPDPTNNTTPTLDWNDVVDAARYHIQINNDVDFSSPIANDDSLTSSTYAPVSALPEGMIYWRVRGIDVAGNEGAFSPPDSFSIDITRPGKPAALQANPGDSQVSLNWNANTEKDVSHYNIYRNENSGFTPTPGDFISRVDKPNTTFTDIGLDNGTTYYYRISAVDSAGNESEFSDEVNATPMPAITHLTVVSIPQDVPAGFASEQITLEAQDESNNPVIIANDLPITLVSDSGTGLFSITNDFDTTVTEIIIPGGASSVNFYYKDTTIGNPKITAIATGFPPAEDYISIIEAITSISIEGSPAKAGDTITITAENVEGAAGGTATFSIVNSKIIEQPMTGIGPYRGTYTVKAGDDVTDATVTVTLNGIDYKALNKVTIDTIVPNAKLILSGTKGENGWYIDDVTVDIESSDGGSGVESEHIKLDENDWQTPPVSITEEGIHTVEFYAKDQAENESSKGSVSVKVDKSKPTTPVITDDGDCTTDGSQLHASWTSSDDDSGISGYKYAIGTTPGGNDVVAWTSVGASTRVTRTGLSLTLGQTYYFAVKAKNGAGLSSAHYSDGITYQLPQISLTPTSFTFNAVVGYANPDAQTLNITNEGCGTLSWSADDDASWLFLLPTNGDCTKDETDNGAASVDITGLTVGTYNATITISATSAPNSPQTVPVKLVITEKIISVSASPTTIPVGIGGKITITVVGEANAQTVTFSIASVSNATDLQMTESQPGNYTGSYIVRNGDSAKDAMVTATMTDSIGNVESKESDDKVTLDGKKPKVESPIATPMGIIPDGNHTSLLTASVTDMVSGVDSVKINLSPVNGPPQQPMYDDGTHGDEIPEDGIYSLLITVAAGTDEGKYDLAVTATDAAGNINNDESIALYVDNTPPTVTEPKADPPVVPGKYTSLLTVNVTDEPFGTLGLSVTIDLSAIGGSENQTMYDDGTHGDKIASDNVYSYETSVICGEENTHSLPITVTDIAAHQETADVELTVQCGPPVAEIAYPTDDACVRGEVCIIGTAEGGSEGLKGWVLQRAFEDEQFITIADGTEPISNGELKCWDTTQETDGDYTLKLKVTDQQFQNAVAQISVKVDNTPPQPNISLSALGSEGDYTKSNTSISVSGNTEPKSEIVSATLTGCYPPLVIKDVTPNITIDADGNISGNFTVGDLSEYSGIKLKVRVRDCPGNESSGESNCLTVDDEIPQVRILTLANCAYFRTLPIPIGGVALDGISGVAKVEINAGSGWIEASGTTNWSVDFYALEPDVPYTIKARVYDKAGNLFVSNESIDIKYYPSSPAANISTPADNSEVSYIVSVMGSVDDTDYDYSDFSWKLSVTPGVSEPCSEDPCSGTVIASGSRPIYEGTLAKWDTTNLPEGKYTLCLTVKNHISEVYIRRTSITVKTCDILYGDVDSDGQITARDAALVLRHIVGLIELSPCEQKAADVTGNGKISSYDAALILEYSVGKRKIFPVQES